MNVLNFVAFIVALAGTVAALGHDGYLAMISSAARKRAGGQPAADFVRTRMTVAGATTVVALIGLLFVAGDSASADIVGLLLGGGGGLGASKALQNTRQRFQKGLY